MLVRGNLCLSTGSFSIKIFSLLRKMSLKETAAPTTILAIIDLKKTIKKKKKMKREWSTDKTLVRTEESAGAVIQGSSVKKGALKNFTKFKGKYLENMTPGQVFFCEFGKIFKNFNL